MIRDIWDAIWDTFALWKNLKPGKELPEPCLVCGYKHARNLEFYPADNNVCGRCGVEFGADDLISSRRDLWRKWVDMGQPWHDPKEEQANALRR